MRFPNVPSIVLLLASVLSVEAGPLPASGVQSRGSVHGLFPPIITEGKGAVEERDSVISGASDESPAVERSLSIHDKRGVSNASPPDALQQRGWIEKPKSPPSIPHKRASEPRSRPVHPIDGEHNKRGGGDGEESLIRARTIVERQKPTPPPKSPNPLIIHTPNNKRTLTFYLSRDKRSDGEGPEDTIEERNPGKGVFGRGPAKEPKKPANPLIIHGSSKRTVTSYLSTDKRSDGEGPEATIEERNPGKGVFGRAPAKGPKKPPNPLIISSHSKRKATSYLLPDKRSGSLQVPKGPGVTIGERNLEEGVFGRADASKHSAKTGNPLIIRSESKIASALSSVKRWNGLFAIEKRDPGKANPDTPTLPLSHDGREKRWNGLIAIAKRGSAKPKPDKAPPDHQKRWNNPLQLREASDITVKKRDPAPGKPDTPKLEPYNPGEKRWNSAFEPLNIEKRVPSDKEKVDPGKIDPDVPGHHKRAPADVAVGKRTPLPGQHTKIGQPKPGKRSNSLLESREGSLVPGQHPKIGQPKPGKRSNSLPENRDE
ncbi:hypothetical protein HYALB_00007153 [Hymenoscyphus albidus]|uniref:Uncharacterized protein n=1 Tax=Hymenoscyphus albidus TaxID=595503 RepID=A0A9N9LHF4_9HELO|nr:hypothetical protein HYALB_00007153 [Hymenoscyphus albidus]